MVCPARGYDGPGAVAVCAGRIVAAGPDADLPARQQFDFPDALLLPGLVDLHAHPARGGSKYGIDPDLHFLPRGVTTVLSQGDAGAANWLDYRDRVIHASRTRVRLAINLSARGESMPGGCFENPAHIDVDACVQAINSATDLIWGIAVNVSTIACGATDPRWVMAQVLAAATRSGKPLLYGMREPRQWPLDEQLSLLRAGDVITYCFRGDDCRILDDKGHIHPAIWEARRRGVLFDVGHGMRSFDFQIAESAIAQGFLPDTISTDKYARHVGQSPVHDLPRTLAKLIAAGMPEGKAFAAVTSRPAEILALENEIGTLTPGACADLAVLRFNPQAAPLRDVHGHERPGGCWEPVLTLCRGQPIWPCPEPEKLF